jgi:hypothetical protein
MAQNDKDTEMVKVESSYGFGIAEQNDPDEDEFELHHSMTLEEKNHKDNRKLEKQTDDWNVLEGKHRGRCTDCTFLVMFLML